jgi:hypothetical protein
MIEARRSFAQGLLSFTLAATFFSFAAGDIARAQSPLGKTPVPPRGGPNPEDEPKVDQNKILKHHQEQIQQDIKRLYSLATDLKNEVEDTNSADILSLTLLQKADEVEKLAHQIKSLAKG